MTTKRTHGPCNCYPPPAGGFKHESSCPSLYPAQQEPDALTRLVRHIRNRMGANSALWEEKSLSLISEAREEHGKARNLGWNDGLEEAARWLEVAFDQPTMAAEVRAKKVVP